MLQYKVHLRDHIRGNFMLSFFNSNPFELMELSGKDLIEVDQIILDAIKAQKVGDPLEILLLTQDELENYNEELADARIKKLNARLKQFKFISGLKFTCEANNQVIIWLFCASVGSGTRAG